MLKLKQIVVSIENSPGRLFEVTHALGNAGINLRALNLVDTGAFGQLRLLVSDVPKARQLLMEMHIPAMVNEVVRRNRGPTRSTGRCVKTDSGCRHSGCVHVCLFAAESGTGRHDFPVLR